MNYKNKTVLITGSSKGIGKAIAKTLLKNKYYVIGISRTHTIKHKNYYGIKQDLFDEEGFTRVLNDIRKSNQNIVAVISNAGSGSFKKLENYSNKDIKNYINLNLISHIILAKTFVDYFKRKKKWIFYI